MNWKIQCTLLHLIWNLSELPYRTQIWKLHWRDALRRLILLTLVVLNLNDLHYLRACWRFHRFPNVGLPRTRSCLIWRWHLIASKVTFQCCTLLRDIVLMPSLLNRSNEQVVNTRPKNRISCCKCVLQLTSNFPLVTFTATRCTWLSWHKLLSTILNSFSEFSCVRHTKSF